MALPERKIMKNEFERLDQLGAEDPDLKILLINMFLAQFPDLVANIETQIVGLSPVETKNAAHTLKGVCLNLGFETTGMLCKQIEDAALAEDFKQASVLCNDLKLSLEDLSLSLKEMIA